MGPPRARRRARGAVPGRGARPAGGVVGTVVYYAAQSLDGYIAASDDSIAWLTGYEGGFAGSDELPLGDPYREFIAGVGALVMGSATFEFCAALDEWPYPDHPTWVLTSRERRVPDGADVRLVYGPVGALHMDVARVAAGRAVWVVGGGNVASQYAAAGLLDRVEVTVVPVVLGDGKPLFDEALGGPPLQLMSTRPFANGMVELRYEVVR